MTVYGLSNSAIGFCMCTTYTDGGGGFVRPFRKAAAAAAFVHLLRDCPPFAKAPDRPGKEHTACSMCVRHTDRKGERAREGVIGMFCRQRHTQNDADVIVEGCEK